jgi:hypothetical protein
MGDRITEAGRPHSTVKRREESILLLFGVANRGFLPQSAAFFSSGAKMLQCAVQQF